jgi:sugar diacid utilization regulator
VEAQDISDRGLSHALRSIAEVLETREKHRSANSYERRRIIATQRLLEGESSDASLLDYNLDGVHLGLVVAGRDVARPLKNLQRRSGSRLLLIEPSPEFVWLWLGGRRQATLGDLDCLLELELPPQAALAYGDPAQGLDGWRLTHRQAMAALPVAQRRPDRIAHYASEALVVAVLHDDLLASSLRQVYLAPLEKGKDDGCIAKSTLRAYFEAAHNASSAAAALGVNRGTVGSRLRAIEGLLGKPLETVSAELEVALRLDALEASNVLGQGPS